MFECALQMLSSSGAGDLEIAQGAQELSPHTRLQDFPTWKMQDTGERRIAWRQELGGGEKFWAAGSLSVQLDEGLIFQG